MPFFRKKTRSVSLKQAEPVIAENKVLRLAGSGDPHEEFGKIRVFIKTINQLHPDLLLFDGDYLAEPAYVKADDDFDTISKQSTQALCEIHKQLLEAPIPSLLAAGNYEIFGTTSDAIQNLGTDQLFDIGCNKGAPHRDHHIYEKPVFMDLDTKRRTWPGNVFVKDNFTFIGVEGSNPINYTFPGERTEKNYRWAVDTPWSEISPSPEQTILVVHCPPFGIRDRLGRFGVPPHLWGAQKGSTGLRDFLDENRPFLTLVGHIHEDFGIHARAWSKGDEDGEPQITDITFRNRTKLLIGYDTTKTTLSITLNKGTLEYWNWSLITIAQQGNLRLIDIEGEWMNRKGQKKAFKKYNKIIEYDEAIASLIS